MDSRVTAENHPDDPFGMGTEHRAKPAVLRVEAVFSEQVLLLALPLLLLLLRGVLVLLARPWILCTLTPRRLVAELRLCKRGRVRGSLLRQGLR